MFESLKLQPPDALLNITKSYLDDERLEKINLGVGVYQDQSGKTPLMEAVAIAEQNLAAEQSTKSYLPMSGFSPFVSSLSNLVLGQSIHSGLNNRLEGIQTAGGCGALRLGAELIQKSNPMARIWIPNMSWPNHEPIFLAANFELVNYSYYNDEGNFIDIAKMMDQLGSAKPGDVIVLHGCCHNPTGADLSFDEWKALTELVLKKGLVPFLDIAYQGLGVDLEEDATGWRYMASKVPELLASVSCSKNFGLYRERTGILILLGESSKSVRAAASTLLVIARSIYGMPPSHGARIVAEVLMDQQLSQLWSDELCSMRQSLKWVRSELTSRLSVSLRDFSFIEGQLGMFSILGLEPSEVDSIRDDFGVYMAGSSRVNLCGLNESNIDYFCDALNRTLL
ncbi:MAG: amino acid aminotransferase [Opitutae bacterium]